jgi:hypothetical protein
MPDSYEKQKIWKATSLWLNLGHTISKLLFFTAALDQTFFDHTVYVFYSSVIRVFLKNFKDYFVFRQIFYLTIKLIHNYFL